MIRSLRIKVYYLYVGGRALNAKFFMPYRTIIIQGVEYKGNTCYKIYDNIFNDVMELVKNNGATLLERCIFF